MLTKKQTDNGGLKRGGRRPFWLDGVGALQFRDEELVMAIFQPDVLIPAQYLTTFKKRHYLEPERALMLAVLEDAVMCFQDYLFATGRHKRMLYEEAEQWFLETSAPEIFSFENICESLGINADYLRSGLMRWKTAALKGHRLTRLAS